MKQIRLLACAVVSLLALSSPLNARIFKVWSNQELTDKSDLVVIATPASTATTEEKLVIAGQPVAGVETKFAVLAVLKVIRRLGTWFYSTTKLMEVECQMAPI